MELREMARLAESWKLQLEGANKSANTVRNYTTGVRVFLSWAAATDRESVTLDRATVAAFTAHLLERGAESQTVYSRYRALRYFSKWLAGPGDEIDADLLLGSKPPAVDAKVVRSLTADETAAMLKACEGRGFCERRDAAILQLMLSTGCRADETLSLLLADIDLHHGTAVITKGKGARGRKIPLGPRTVAALDRYLRSRRRHKHSGSPRLWLSVAGPGLGYTGLHKTLRRRADIAGVGDFTPHMLRHTFAVRWKRARGSNEGLKSIAGWKTDKMIGRYIEDVAAELAAEEATRLRIDDL